MVKVSEDHPECGSIGLAVLPIPSIEETNASGEEQFSTRKRSAQPSSRISGSLLVNATGLIRRNALRDCLINRRRCLFDREPVAVKSTKWAASGACAHSLEAITRGYPELSNSLWKARSRNFAYYSPALFLRASKSLTYTRRRCTSTHPPSCNSEKALVTVARVAPIIEASWSWV